MASLNRTEPNWTEPKSMCFIWNEQEQQQQQQQKNSNSEEVTDKQIW